MFLPAVQPPCVLTSCSQCCCALASSSLHHLLQMGQQSGVREEEREDRQKEKNLFISFLKASHLSTNNFRSFLVQKYHFLKLVQYSFSFLQCPLFELTF